MCSLLLSVELLPRPKYIIPVPLVVTELACVHALPVPLSEILTVGIAEKVNGNAMFDTDPK